MSFRRTSNPLSRCVLYLILDVSFLLLIAPASAQPYENIQVNTSNYQPEETSIGINPLNPANVIGVAQVPPSYHASFDAGSTWTEGFLNDPYALGDPCMVFGPYGAAYYCYIGTFAHSGIFFNRSLDGGLTWPSWTAVIEHGGDTPFEDKPMPACDWSNSPYRGSVYVSWTQFTQYDSFDPADSSAILFSASRDGAQTFTPPIYISDLGGASADGDSAVEGASPAVGPDGTVYVSWAGPRGIEFDVSYDGGMTFGEDQVITDQPGGWDFNIAGIYRCGGFPTTETDISPGIYRGRVYVMWSDRRNGDCDVFLIHSDDHGVTWSPRIRVNTDQPVGNGKHQFFPWIDVDPITGHVYIVFYDRREHEDRTTDVYLAVSTDGGVSFTNEKISEESFWPNPGIFFGDYIGIAAYGGWVRPLWTRMDGTLLSIWTALIDPDAAGIVVSVPTSPAFGVFPNPVTSSVAQVLFYGERSLSPTLVICDVQGRVIRRLEQDTQMGRAASAEASCWLQWDGRDAHGGLVASGTYLIDAGREGTARVVVIR